MQKVELSKHFCSYHYHKSKGISLIHNKKANFFSRSGVNTFVFYKFQENLFKMSLKVSSLFRFIFKIKIIMIPARHDSLNVHQSFMKYKNELRLLVIKVSCYVHKNEWNHSKVTFPLVSFRILHIPYRSHKSKVNI